MKIRPMVGWAMSIKMAMDIDDNLEVNKYLQSIKMQQLMRRLIKTSILF